MEHRLIQGLSQHRVSLTLTHNDGLYVAGEKVVTEGEHRRIVGALRDELRSALDILNLTRTGLQETRSEVLALVQALREVSPANGSAILQPPTCEEPGGDKLHFNGTQWLCICFPEYYGESCQYSRTDAPTVTTTTPTLSPTISPTVVPSIALASSFVGCFRDGVGSRVLQKTTSVVSCVSACSGRGYRYFGFECAMSDGFHWDCGNAISEDRRKNNSECTTPAAHCVGPFSQQLHGQQYYLGSAWREAVYEVARFEN